jgi:hypothetical protein
MQPNPKMADELARLSSELYEHGYIEAARLIEEARRIVLELEREAFLTPATD